LGKRYICGARPARAHACVLCVCVRLIKTSLSALQAALVSYIRLI
jgi:hypothetical protein